MTAHDWKPVPEHSEPHHLVDRCTNCGVYRICVRTEDGKYPLFTRYSPQNANINNTLPWRRDAPFCKTQTEPTPQPEESAS